MAVSWLAFVFAIVALITWGISIAPFILVVGPSVIKPTASTTSFMFNVCDIARCPHLGPSRVRLPP